LDSTGLGVFLSAYKSAIEHESSLELIHARDRVSSLFKVSGLDEVMNLSFDDINKECKCMEVFDFMVKKVPANADYVGVISLRISGAASRVGFSYEAIEDLKVAISEAVTNVVSHAYEKKEKGEALIGFAVYENRLE